MLYHDKSKNKYLNGLHEPVTEEISYKVSNFNGKVPFDLNGVYLRNGK
jgi:carotenoid cleavage dioxygenase-like enzyme